MCLPFSDLSQMSAQWTEPSELDEMWPTPEPDCSLWTPPPHVRKADGIFDDDKDDFANRSETWPVRRLPMEQRRPRCVGKEDWHLCSCGEMHYRGVGFFAEDDCRDRQRRYVWTPGINRVFYEALAYLGEETSPKPILHYLISRGIRHLTRVQVSSRLQKYREKRGPKKKRVRKSQGIPSSSHPTKESS